MYMSVCVSDRQEVLQPVIRTNPASRDAYRGENVTLSCSAVITVDADLTVSWKKDNTVGWLVGHWGQQWPLTNVLSIAIERFTDPTVSVKH